MKRDILIALLTGLLLLVPVANASSSCRGCNIVDEGVYGPGLIGTYVYERGRKSFFRVRVTRVDVGMVALYWVSDEKNDSGWNDARSYYTEASMNELLASGQTAGSELTPFDKEQKNALWATCALYVTASKNAQSFWDTLMVIQLRRSCCESQHAQQYGTPPGVC